MFHCVKICAIDADVRMTVSLSWRCWYNTSVFFRLIVSSAKIQVYRAVIVPTLLYSAETWVLYWKQIRLLEWFHQQYLHSILGIKGKTACRTKKPSREPACPA